MEACNDVLTRVEKALKLGQESPQRAADDGHTASYQSCPASANAEYQPSKRRRLDASIDQHPGSDADLDGSEMPTTAAAPAANLVQLALDDLHDLCKKVGKMAAQKNITREELQHLQDRAFLLLTQTAPGNSSRTGSLFEKLLSLIQVLQDANGSASYDYGYEHLLLSEQQLQQLDTIISTPDVDITHVHTAASIMCRGSPSSSDWQAKAYSAQLAAVLHCSTSSISIDSCSMAPVLAAIHNQVRWDQRGQAHKALAEVFPQLMPLIIDTFQRCDPSTWRWSLLQTGQPSGTDPVPMLELAVYCLRHLPFEGPVAEAQRASMEQLLVDRALQIEQTFINTGLPVYMRPLYDYLASAQRTYDLALATLQQAVAQQQVRAAVAAADYGLQA